MNDEIDSTLKRLEKKLDVIQNYLTTIMTQNLEKEYIDKLEKFYKNNTDIFENNRNLAESVIKFYTENISLLQTDISTYDWTYYDIFFSSHADKVFFNNDSSDESKNIFVLIILSALRYKYQQMDINFLFYFEEIIDDPVFKSIIQKFQEEDVMLNFFNDLVKDLNIYLNEDALEKLIKVLKIE